MPLNLSKKNKEYSHYMAKEIFEQPDVVRVLIKTYLDKVKHKTRLETNNKNIKKLRKAERVILIGCGTSYHACLLGQYFITEFSDLPATAVLAHEFSGQKQAFSQKTVVIVLSQSGETSDTLAAVRVAKKLGGTMLALTNNTESKLAKLADITLPLLSGEEKAVAATKTFTAECVLLGILAVYLGRARGLKRAAAKRIIREIELLPEKIEKLLRFNLNIQILANKYYKANDIMVLGRKFGYPAALEAALKFKEAAYVHAEGLAAGELKHGPLASLDKSFPVLFFAPLDSVYKKSFSLIKELGKLKKRVIAVTTQGNRQLVAHTNAAIYLPKTLEALYPILTLIPLQLLVYHTAVLRGINPDKPRHLNKFVA